MEKDLTILTVAYNDRGLLRYTIESAKRYTDRLKEIIICDNGNNRNQLDKYKNDPMIRIVKHSPKVKGGSNRHGEGLNKIFPLVKTTYAAIVESDCVVFDKGWCEFDLEKYKVVTPLKSVSNNKKTLYVCFVLLNVGAVGKKIDLRAGTDKNRRNRAYKNHEDVGWRVVDAVNDSDILWLETTQCKTGNGRIFDSRFSYKTFEIYRDGNPDNVIAAHFYRGSDIYRRGQVKGLSADAQLKLWKKILKNKLGI